MTDNEVKEMMDQSFPIGFNGPSPVIRNKVHDNKIRISFESSVGELMILIEEDKSSSFFYGDADTSIKGTFKLKETLPKYLVDMASNL